MYKLAAVYKHVSIEEGTNPYEYSNNIEELRKDNVTIEKNSQLKAVIEWCLKR